MSQNVKTDKRPITLELAALFVFSLVLIGNLSVTNFAQGYYSHFDVTLPEINFAPQVYDYVNIVLASLIGAGVVVLAVVFLMKLGMWVGEFVADRTKPSKKLADFVKKRERKFITAANLMEWILRTAFWGVAAFTLYSSVSVLSDKLGELSAQNKASFSSISPEGEDLQKVIIYKNDNEIILKTYSVSRKEFVEGYEAINGATYTTRTIRI